MPSPDRTTLSTAATDPEPVGRRMLRAFNAGSLGVAIGFAVATAIVVSPIFDVSFHVLLGRSLFLAMVLLVVFAAVQSLPERRLPGWLPRWLLSMLAVIVVAPAATFVAYLATTGGSVSEFVGHPGRVTGFVIISGTALVLGLVVTLTAQLREREARARSLALEFELERARLEKQAVDARLALLQAQIEPHFLFNTLANVQALVESNSPRAATVLHSLIAYLRAAMPRLHGDEPTLGNEVDLVRAYLELMQMRMPDRLGFTVDVPAEARALRFPAMALLTLVENAVRHGIDPGCDGGHISVGARRDGSEWCAWVADTGVGMSEHTQPGTGLANLRDRLPAFFGAGAVLQLSTLSPHGVRAEIRWQA